MTSSPNYPVMISSLNYLTSLYHRAIHHLTLNYQQRARNGNFFIPRARVLVSCAPAVRVLKTEVKLYNAKAPIKVQGASLIIAKYSLRKVISQDVRHAPSHAVAYVVTNARAVMRYSAIRSLGWLRSLEDYVFNKPHAGRLVIIVVMRTVTGVITIEMGRIVKIVVISHRKIKQK